MKLIRFYVWLSNVLYEIGEALSRRAARRFEAQGGKSGSAEYYRIFAGLE